MRLLIGSFVLSAMIVTNTLTVYNRAISKDIENDFDRAFDRCKHICNLASKDLTCIDEEAECILNNIEAEIYMNHPEKEPRGALDTK